jgi:hypothetical protein
MAPAPCGFRGLEHSAEWRAKTDTVDEVTSASCAVIAIESDK